MLNNTLGILVTILLLFSACKDEEPPNLFNEGIAELFYFEK